jgi:hypothetical protein
MRCKFRSYSDVAAFFRKARKPHEGRPVSTSRVFRDGERYILRRYGETLCEIHPDNTLVLRTVPSGGAGTVLNTLFGLILHYRAPSKYRVVMRPWLQAALPNNYSWQELRDCMNTQSYAFAGQRFDMLSGECLNPKGDPVRQRVAEPASEWDRLLRRYQRGWRLRSRIGAFDWVGPAHREALGERLSGLTTRGLQQIITDEDYGNEVVMRIFNEFTWKHLRQWQRDEFWAGKRSLEHVFMTTYQPFRDQIRHSLGCFVVVEKK